MIKNMIKSLRQNKLLRQIVLPIRRKILYSIADKYFISFPKSGRTWIRFFLAKYFASKYGLPLIMDYFTLKKHGSIPRFHLTHGVFFGESIAQLHRSLSELKNKDVMLLVRDPRDIVVSFYFHDMKRQSFLNAEQLTLSEFIRREQLGLKRIVEYLNAIYANRLNFKSFSFIRYEDLKVDKSEFSKILTFLEEDIDAAAFDYAYEESSFNNMKSLEQKQAINHPSLQTANTEDNNAYKVRKGVVGGFKSEFSSEDMEYAADCMKDLNPIFNYSI